MYIRDVAKVFNIKSINRVIKEETKHYFDKDIDADEMVDNVVIGNSLYTYNYESEIWFLKGKERKKFLQYFKDYFIEVCDEEEYNERKSDFNSFFNIATEYAWQYIINNYEEWYKEWSS